MLRFFRAKALHGDIIRLEEVSNIIETHIGCPRHMFVEDEQTCLIDMKYYYNDNSALQLHSFINESVLLLKNYEFRMAHTFQTTNAIDMRQIKKQRTDFVVTGDNCPKESPQKGTKVIFLDSLLLDNTRSISFYHVLKTIQLTLGNPIDAYLYSSDDKVFAKVELYQNNLEASRCYNILQESPLLMNGLEMRIRI